MLVQTLDREQIVGRANFKVCQEKNTCDVTSLRKTSIVSLIRYKCQILRHRIWSQQLGKVHLNTKEIKYNNF